MQICELELPSLPLYIRDEIIQGWCNVARVSNIVSHKSLEGWATWLKMPDESLRLPKRVLFGHIDGR